jgi:pimeloyl-ACP methyl ester carboxylesterase
MPFLETADAVIHYEVVPGLLPRDTIFLHGNLASNRWWQPVTAALGAATAATSRPGRAILVEWRGLGQSRSLGLSVPPERQATVDFALLARDVNDVAHALKARDAALVGHSTGGLIGLHAVWQEPAAYERILLLDAVAPRPLSLDPKLLASFEAMSRDRAVCAAVLAGTIHGVDPASPYFQSLVDDAMQAAPHIWSGVPEALAKIDVMTFDRLAHTTQPTLVLHGRLDPVLSLEDARAMAAALPNGRFVELAGHGHSFNVEAPRDFARVLLEFLA